MPTKIAPARAKIRATMMDVSDTAHCEKVPTVVVTCSDVAGWASMDLRLLLRRSFDEPIVGVVGGERKGPCWAWY
jgi:hypothetical protein